MTPIELNGAMLGVGRAFLHTLRRSLDRDLGVKSAVCLQEAGYAAGAQIYQSFCAWLPGYTGIDDPSDLDSNALGEVLSAYFEAIGWGRLTVERAGKSGIAITSSNWAESDPGAHADLPSCYVASGMFADFMGRLAGTPVAVMEVECRTRNESRCKFLLGAPETMESVYEALTNGDDYESALSS
ncbi:MAG: V4R domain-containing protein [Gemmatimonadales bacterium]